MRVVALVQARMTSSRLPGKVLRDLGGRLVIERVVTQLQHCRRLDGIVLATSSDESDDPLVEWAIQHQCVFHRGPLADVLSRFIQAASRTAGLNSHDAVVRITADCPLVQPDIVDEAISTFKKSECAYCSNVAPRSFPDGFDVEVVRVSSLEQADLDATTAYDREHVTSFIRERPQIFPQASVISAVNRSNWRLTLDTKDDFQLIQDILKDLKAGLSCVFQEDILRIVEQTPELASRVIL